MSKLQTPKHQTSNIDNIKRQTSKHQKIKHRNIKMPNIKTSNVRHRNITSNIKPSKHQNAKHQSVKNQNIKTSNTETSKHRNNKNQNVKYQTTNKLAVSQQSAPISEEFNEPKLMAEKTILGPILVGKKIFSSKKYHQSLDIIASNENVQYKKNWMSQS